MAQFAVKETHSDALRSPQLFTNHAFYPSSTQSRSKYDLQDIQSHSARLRHPALDLAHAPLLQERLVHVEAVEQHVWLVAPALLEALVLGLLEVRLEDRLVVVVGALVDDDPGALPWAQAAHVGEAGLGDDDVQVVLRLVDVRAHGHDAADADGVRLGRPRRGRVHDAVLGRPQEVGRAAQAVEHAAAHHVGAVGVGVDVHFDRGVHADDAESADDLGGVGDLLGSEKQLVVVGFPAVVEALESIRRESHRCRSREVELAGIEEIEEGVLDDFGPHFHVLEI